MEFLRTDFSGFTWILADLLAPSALTVFLGKLQRSHSCSEESLEELLIHHGFIPALQRRECAEENSACLIHREASKFCQCLPAKTKIHPDYTYLNGSGKWGRTRRKKCSNTESQREHLLPSCPTLDNILLSRMAKLSWLVNPRANLYPTPFYSCSILTFRLLPIPLRRSDYKVPFSSSHPLLINYVPL